LGQRGQGDLIHSEIIALKVWDCRGRLASLPLYVLKVTVGRASAGGPGLSRSRKLRIADMAEMDGAEIGGTETEH
jgi:hypothetical protein